MWLWRDLSAMSERARNEDGQFVETVTPERVLAVMRDGDAPVLTAGDIAEELGCTPEAVTKKLKELRRQNRVNRRQVGARAVVWWLTARSPLDTDGDHDFEAPFFAAPPLDAEDGTPIEVSDTDAVLGDAIDSGDLMGD
jgi:DNA-binding CsgD family transcriptional regulator